MTTSNLEYLATESSLLEQAYKAGEYAGRMHTNASVFAIWGSLQVVFVVHPKGRYYSIKHKVRRSFIQGFKTTEGKK